MFKAWGMTIPQDYQFKGKLQVDQRSPLVFDMHIIPIREVEHPDCDEVGQIVFSLPGIPETTKALAHNIALQIKEHIAFPNARVQFLGLVYWTKLPETPEEEREDGANQTFAEMILEEKPKVPIFDPKRISSIKGNNQSALLMQQFNLAKDLIHPVEKFLAFFKVLEKAYTDGQRGNVLNLLSKSDAFFNIVRSILRSPTSKDQPMTKEEFRTFIKKLLRLRDNCAHLRNKTGYSPTDSRLRTEVEPYLITIQIITQKVVESTF